MGQLRFLELPQRQPPTHLVPHLLATGLVRGHEDNAVAEEAERRAVRTLARVDSVDQVGHALHCPVERHGIVRDHHQLGPAFARFVGHVVGAARKAHGLQGLAREDPADAVVQVGAHLFGVHVALLATDDLRQVGLCQEAHRRAGPVVQVSGLADELLARAFDEAEVRGGAEHRVAQVSGRQPLERVVVRQRVQEDCAGRVLGVGRQSPVMFGVDLLSERLLAGLGAGARLAAGHAGLGAGAGLAAGHVGVDGRHVARLA